MSSELDKKLHSVKIRLEALQDPEKVQRDSLGKILPVLDRLEVRLGNTEYVCGLEYSLADTVFTCTLARLSMLGLLEDVLATRPRLSQGFNSQQS